MLAGEFAAFALPRVGQYYLFGQRLEGTFKGVWQPPGGGVLPTDETLENAVRRETWEELAVGLKRTRLRAVIQARRSNGLPRTLIVFTGKHHNTPRPSQEMGNPRFFRRSELPLDAMHPEARLWLPHVLGRSRRFPPLSLAVLYRGNAPVGIREVPFPVLPLPVR